MYMKFIGTYVTSFCVLKFVRLEINKLLKGMRANSK